MLAALNIAFDAAHRDPALAFRNSSFGAPDGADGGDSAALPAGTEEALRTMVARIDAALSDDDRLL